MFKLLGSFSETVVSVMKEKSMTGQDGRINLPLLGGLPAKQQYKVAVIGFACCFALTAVTLSVHNWLANNTAKLVATATDMTALSERIAKDAKQVSLGSNHSLKTLRSERENFDAALALVQGNFSLHGNNDVSRIGALWKNKAKPNVDLLIETGESITFLNKKAEAIVQDSQRLRQALDYVQPLLIQGTNQVFFRAKAFGVRGMTQDIEGNALRMFRTETLKPDVAQKIQNSALRLDNLVHDVIGTPIAFKLDFPVESLLGNLAKITANIAQNSNALTKQEGLMKKISDAKSGAMILYDQGESMASLSGAIRESAESNTALQNFALILSLLAATASVAMLGVLSAINSNETKRQAAFIEHENRKNQDAILRMLNEMGDLANGDLTVKATVDETMVGAIADSVNFAVDEMRGLVRKIYATSETVNEEAGNVVASVDAGRAAINDSIRAMHQLREESQDASKRIKRLGESSQQIGEIVGLVQDIAAKTGILAMNAQIQAASAGDAGRGFSVVAEEVAKLANEVTEYADRIAASIKTIQNDTNETVAAMERSTLSVVEANRCSDEASTALQKIVTVTESLDHLSGELKQLSTGFKVE